MSLDDREYVRGKHPPACQCTECTKLRLERIKEHPELMYPLSEEILRGPHVPDQEGRGSGEGRHNAMQFNRNLRTLVKLLMNLVVLTGLGTLVWFGYKAFSGGPESQEAAVRSACIFIAGVVAWVLFISLSRRGLYRYTNPSLKLTALSVLGVVFVFGLAGVEPVASYFQQVATWLSVLLGWTALVAFLNPLTAIFLVLIAVWIVYDVRHRY